MIGVVSSTMWATHRCTIFRTGRRNVRSTSGSMTGVVQTVYMRPDRTGDWVMAHWSIKQIVLS